MAEAMTVELIIEAYWQLLGYWTKIRFPFQPKSFGWSDIDVIAYHPRKRDLVICESKVQGPKKTVFAYTKDTQLEKGSIFNHIGGNYLSFVDNLPTILKDNVIFEDTEKMVKHLTIQLVSNYYIVENDNVKAKELAAIKSRIKKHIKKIKFDIRLDTTFDIICEIITNENSVEQGRRYGNPILDLAREINRYMNPKISGAGHTSEARRQITEHFKNELITALGWQKLNK